MTAQQQNMKNVLGVVLEKTIEIQRQGVNSILLTIGRSDRKENKKEFHKEFSFAAWEVFLSGKRQNASRCSLLSKTLFIELIPDLGALLPF